MQDTDLILVKPGGRLNLFGALAPALSGFAPPLDIGLLASFLREKGFRVKIIDADAEFLAPQEVAARIVEYNPLLVGIFTHTIRMAHTNKTIKELRKKAPQIKILLGGRHPSSLPEKTLLEEGPDFVCQGEAFYPLLELLGLLKSKKESSDYKIMGLWYRKNGSIISSLPAPLINDLDTLPFIAWDLLPLDKYRAHNWHCFDKPKERQPYAIIYSSIGCPYKCTYCCVNAAYGGSGIRFRSPQKVAEEIDYLVKGYGIRNIRIVDDIFTLKPKRVIELCDLIIKRNYNLNIWCYARVDTVNEEMLKKMRQAGIRWICFGIEAGHERVREGVFKRLDLKKIKEGISLTQKAGIYIIANFVFGLPDDDLETMQATLDMAKEFNFEYVNFYVAMAWPGSKLYEDALRQGMRLPEDWSGYAQLSEDTLPLPTKYISASEVLRFRDKAFVEYFSNPRYLEMMEGKFGSEVAGDIKNMLKYKINRKFA
ncbi:MAG TPA: radical SAM protein [Candidatus Omnitrophota bacterium]|nr:radical SAM protein [Candidatus Omnitrophota bacterium]